MPILQGSSRSKTVRKFCQNELGCVSCERKKAPKKSPRNSRIPTNNH
ncbi:MAG: hypothetical protein MR927_02475 [Campylobacter sp.]|nr:hypothetical protein [Campylobacter sp.]